MTKTWILVADASRARVIALDADGRPPELVAELEHPGSRAKGMELSRDDRGRTRPRNRHAARGAALSKPTPPKAVEANAFAREVADTLGTACRRQAFDDLVLVASPSFLGSLRSHLDTQAAGRVTASWAKDYTREPVEVVLTTWA